MTYDLVLEGANVFYEGKAQDLNIGVKDGKIAALEPSKLTGDKTISLKDKVILPGLIDSQAHFREPGTTHKEDINTGTLSALAGGITAILEMPNTKPPTTNPEALAEKVNIAEKNAWVDFGFFIGAAHENTEQLPELEKLPSCCGIKIFMGSSTGSLLLDDDSDLEKVFSTAKGPIATHCEDEKRLVERKDIATQAGHPKAHPEWRDEESAFLATQRVVELSKKYNKKVHILHISSKKEVLFLEDVKDNNITFECTPQHLSFQAPDCYEELGTLTQMNPPIRSKEHREALVAALKKGVVDVIGSDHAPHTLEEKQKPYPNSPAGMPGVQTIATVLYKFVQNGDIDLARYVDLLCTKPAEIYHLKERGRIEKGWEANFSVLDPNKEILITDEMIKSKCGWTPYRGQKFKGLISEAFLRGQLVMQDGQVVGQNQGKTLQYLK